MLEDTVLAYLWRANIPYSCTDLTEILRNAYEYKMVQDALDHLIKERRIKFTIKENQPVYFATHNGAEAAHNVNDALIGK